MTSMIIHRCQFSYRLDVENGELAAHLCIEYRLYRSRQDNCGQEIWLSSYVCIQRLDEASKLLLINTSSPLCKGLPPYSLCPIVLMTSCTSSQMIFWKVEVLLRLQRRPRTKDTYSALTIQSCSKQCSWCLFCVLAASLSR